MNTLFDYLYRDGSNYKRWGSIVFVGELTDSLRQRFVAALESHEFFIAEQIRVPEVFPDTWPMYADDHCWHEWAGFERVESQPTDSFARSIEQFVREVEDAAKRGWQDFDPQNRHRHASRGVREVRVPDEIASKIESAARERGVSVEELLRASLEEKLARDAEFKTAAAEVLAKNTELYKRLS